MHQSRSSAVTSTVDTPIQIRRAHTHEAALLSVIATEAKMFWPYSAAQIAAWRDDLTISAEAVQSFPTYIAEIESKPVGFFSIEPGTQTWNLEHLWVLPSAMGRGVGRALLTRAMAIAKAGGADAITIDADPHAEPFYLACGAIRTGTTAAPIDGELNRERPQLLLGT
jgi:GNAT superfamily N-acetyltransferase